MTPNYPYPGKRPIFNSTFYPTLKEDNVELVPRAVESVTATGVVDVDGVEREIDILVMSTGSSPRTTWLGSRSSAATVRRCTSTGPASRAFLGITVPGFPNFFMLYGPGTNGGEIVTLLERSPSTRVRVMKRMMRETITAVEVKPWWADRYHQWLQSTMEGTSWTMSNNYFKSPTGKIVTQWPYGARLYRFMTKLLGPFSERTRVLGSRPAPGGTTGRRERGP